jgi:hypothetical protein
MRNNQRSHWFLAFQDELDWFSFAQKTNAELIGLKMPENQAQSIENLKIYNDLTRALIMQVRLLLRSLPIRKKGLYITSSGGLLVNLLTR